MRTNSPPATARNRRCEPRRRTRSHGLWPYPFRSRALSAALVATLTIAHGAACSPSVTRNVGEPPAGDAVATDIAAASPTIALEPLAPDSIYPAPGTPAFELGHLSPDPAAGPDGYPAPDRSATASALPGTLAAALGACDVEKLEDVLHIRFTVLRVPDGGTDLLDRYTAARWLAEQDCLSDGQWLESEPPHTVLAPVAETLRGAIYPTDIVVAVFYSGGLGADGRGEARWTVLQTEDGKVGLGALEMAPAGFSSEAVVEAGATRTVSVTTRRGQLIAIDIPVEWHTDGKNSSGAITSYLPYAYAYSDEPFSKGFAPGQTKIEFYDDNRNDDRTIEERIASSTWYEEAPRSTHVQRIALDSGETASLARFEYEHAASTILFIETEVGVLTAPCYGDQGPCEAILKTVRLE